MTLFMLKINPVSQELISYHTPMIEHLLVNDPLSKKLKSRNEPNKEWATILPYFKSASSSRDCSEMRTNTVRASACV